MSAAPELHLVDQGEADLCTGFLLSQVTILGERKGGLIDAMVPVGLINREDVPVDQEHVAELVASMRQEASRGKGSGQLSPILLGEVNGGDKFLIIDGFHRDAALHETGTPEICATIRSDSTLEEVLDLRILTANTHASVTFARINEWIGDAWARSPWANKLSVVQAFALTKTSSSGKLLGLSQDEVAKVKDWVTDKCDKWRMSPSTVHINLTTAELADPELVKEARRRTGGHALTEITPQHLGVIAKGLPRRYPEQRLAATIAKVHNMNVPTTRAVVNRLRPTTSYEEAQQVADATDWLSIVPTYSPSHTRQLVRESKERNSDEDSSSIEPAADTTLGKKLVVSELQLSKLALAVTVLRGTYNVPATDAASEFYIRVDDVTNDREITELVRCTDVNQNLEVFFRSADKHGDKLLAILESNKYGLSHSDARSAVRDSSMRIVADMENGDLRFVELARESTAHDLLVNCLLEELKRRREQTVHSSRLGSAVVSKTGQPDVISLTNVIHGVRAMSDNERRAMIAHGLLGLSSNTTAAIIGEPALNIPIRIHDAQAAINEAAKNREKKALAKTVLMR